MTLFGPRRLGLALGSGAARGIAHIGVLKVLDAEGLAPDVIAGTSMGALIGALYAAGITPDEIERIALEFDPKTVTGFGDVALGKGAVFSGAKVETFFRQHLPATFEELRMPFGCVATDLTRNVAVRFTSGDLISALRASVSVPLAFLPVRMDEMLLVDGYVCEPVPVRLVRHLGAQRVVAVDVCGRGTVALTQGSDAIGLRELTGALREGQQRERGSSAVDIVGAVSEAFEARVAQQELRLADVRIAPDIRDVGGFEFAVTKRLIAAGEAAALEALEAVRRTARRPATDRPTE